MTDEPVINPEHADPDGPDLAVRDEDDDPLSLIGDDVPDEDQDDEEDA